jgi:rubrerythrin
MKQWKSVDEVLDFAITHEESAAKFYTDLASRLDNPAMKQVLLDFSKEEEGHKAKLLEVKKGKKLEPSSEKIMDLKIGDYLANVDTEGEFNYQRALILAMKREKASYKLYTKLADSTDDPDIKSTMQALAQEEAKHKLRIEIEYDENVLREM